jgi:N-acetylglucosaminyldiphosphoundecaprenol N-acetyl-beta-D-mannosaminyltransferase
MAFDLVDILGVKFINTSQEKFVKKVEEHIEANEKAFIVTANPEIVMKARNDKKFASILSRTSYITPDGVGVKIASNMLKKPITERITGFDTMIDLLALGNQKNFSIYLLGAKDTILQKAKEKINERYPGIKIVGSHHGFFDLEDSTISDDIQMLRPDIVFVALGSPRQEVWIDINFPHFTKGIYMGVGGSFDILSGEVKRAPKFWRAIQLEWFYRLMQQPWRWKRMLQLPLFLIEVFKEKMNK